jgi:hypothetical protein
MDRTYAATASGLVAIDDEVATTQLPGRDVRAVAIEGDRWWAVAGDELVTRAAGNEWTAAPTLDRYEPRCVLPARDAALVGTSEAHLFLVDAHGAELVEGFEKVEGRSDWFTPWGGPPDVRSLSEGGGRTHVNVHVGGIVRSTDRRSWQPTIDIHADVHEVLAVEGSDRVLAATAWGLAESDDAGESWEFEDDGLHATYCRAVAACDSTVLMSASLGPRGGRAAVYRRPASGGPFEKCERGLPEWFTDNIDTGCLAAASARAVFGTRDGDVFVSEDAGDTWAQVSSGLSPVNQVLVLE